MDSSLFLIHVQSRLWPRHALRLVARTVLRNRAAGYFFGIVRVASDFAAVQVEILDRQYRVDAGAT